MRISAIVFIYRIYYLTDPFSVWNSTTSFRMNNVAKRRIRLDDGEKSKIMISSVLNINKYLKLPTSYSLVKFLKYNKWSLQKLGKV